MAADRRRALEEWLEGLARFGAWSDAHPVQLAPAAALAECGRLYELLPPESRLRPVDPSGIVTLHRLLQRATRAA